MLGLKTRIPAYALMDKLRDNALMTAAAGDDVLRILPPLIIEDEHIDMALAAMRKVLEEWE